MWDNAMHQVYKILIHFRHCLYIQNIGLDLHSCVLDIFHRSNLRILYNLGDWLRPMRRVEVDGASKVMNGRRIWQGGWGLRGDVRDGSGGELY
jgi:hypothetical protein